MGSQAAIHLSARPYPVDVVVLPVLRERNRLTTAFRPILALPHLLLVGGPMAAVMTWERNSDFGWSAGAGVLGAVAAVCALIGWFAIVFTGRQPGGLERLAAFYLRWRVRASAYVALLEDDYPPFADEPYPARLELVPATEPRDRWSVAFRIILAIPHFIAVWAIGVAWAFTTIFAWFAILFTGRYPLSLYEFACGALRWTTRVEAYLLLLTDEYPPFSLEA